MGGAAAVFAAFGAAFGLAYYKGLRGTWDGLMLRVDHVLSCHIGVARVLGDVVLSCGKERFGGRVVTGRQPGGTLETRRV